MNRIIHANNIDVLPEIKSESIGLIYIDPPFNTGKQQARTRIKTVRDDAEGDRVGYQGKAYRTEKQGTMSYGDVFDDFMEFLQPRLIEAHRVLAEHGTLYFHIDYREVHYCKVLLDGIFGRENFMNEVIWAYDYGGRPKDRWPQKHDNILVYAKKLGKHTFNYEEIERIPYMAPGLVSKEKAAKGKMPTDTWWHTIVPTNGKERTGYPTQKPLGIMRRIVQASSRPDDTVLDFFAGSGTTGAACLEFNRKFILVDENIEAMNVMAKRFDGEPDIEWEGFDPAPLQTKVAEARLF